MSIIIMVLTIFVPLVFLMVQDYKKVKRILFKMEEYGDPVEFTQLLDTDKIKKDTRRQIWNEINKYIKTGELQGNGYDKTAERNGLILAANILFELGI